MNVCLLFSEHNEKLRFQFSNYVASYCIAKVNKDEINNYKALRLMRDAYNYSSDDTKICKNIITLIRFNLMEILNERTKSASDIYRILDEILPKRSDVFIREAKQLAQERKDILAHLKSSGNDVSLFEDNIFPNYLLAYSSQRRLTDEGEKLKKVLSYFKTLSEAPSQFPQLRPRRAPGRSDNSTI
jgi:CRISPR/Cas system CSM-associated protein Csm2 small subunit